LGCDAAEGSQELRMLGRTVLNADFVGLALVVEAGVAAVAVDFVSDHLTERLGVVRQIHCFN
jgi:hypothetical protein